MKLPIYVLLCFQVLWANFALAAQPSEYRDADVFVAGLGIMSATYITILRKLDPNLRIEAHERLGGVALESSGAWNNAGTGHAALCELNYTPLGPRGEVDIAKAVRVNEAFEVSKQFWAYLVERGVFGSEGPGQFIHSVPHLSLVRGEEDIRYLRTRYRALMRSHLFDGMKYSEDARVLSKWMPLIMGGDHGDARFAATWSSLGTDVDFGQLTRRMVEHFSSGHKRAQVFLKSEVIRLEKGGDGFWRVRVKNRESGKVTEVKSKFVFLGAGGGALSLLQKSGIPQADIYGGFPISGRFLVARDPSLVKELHAIVYGKASVGSPPMSVPHLDTRIIDGKRVLVFGPFAGFSPKFLKEGSVFDLMRSIHTKNVGTMVSAGYGNLSLVGYLLEQLAMTHEDRMSQLRRFVPDARSEDWELITAGQRVQVIKNDPEKGPVLQFGTEVVTSEDGTLSALLGASPGASTSVSIVLDILGRSFPLQMELAWNQAIKEMIPSFGESLAENPELTQQVRAWSHRVLGLDEIFGELESMGSRTTEATCDLSLR